MPTKAELEADLAKAERKVARLEKAAEEAKSAPPPKAEKKKVASLDDIKVAIYLQQGMAEDDAVLIHLIAANSAIDRALSAKHAHNNIYGVTEREEE